MEQIFKSVKKASNKLNLINDSIINEILITLAEKAENQRKYILEENKKDLKLMSEDNPKYDRLKLTEERIESITNDIRNVASLLSPLGKILMKKEQPNGMLIKKISVPFGVIGVIYEARPNVSFDVFSLCLKAGNACILKGGSDAYNSNKAIVEIIRDVLLDYDLDPNICTLLPTDKEAVSTLLNADKYVDLIIPRGGRALIDYVRNNSRIPIIETGAGVCHTYFNSSGNKEIAQDIIFNAKTRRVSVCNSLDCLIIDKERLLDLPYLCDKLQKENVVIYADSDSFNALKENYPLELLKIADKDSFGTEFLDYKMSIKTVNNFDEAINHIEEYSSKHSEAIITDNQDYMYKFEKLIDAACVYVNVSTAFTDGAQFGLGAEIGISTQKLHARGPMALEEICSYKWIIEGTGQIRTS